MGAAYDNAEALAANDDTLSPDTRSLIAGPANLFCTYTIYTSI
jgi:hypothetical protein